MSGLFFDPPLTCAEWAWQFLRRNPEYRADHAWFSATWSALERDYGSPPNRDFYRWKQDPRAWRGEHEATPCDTEACVTENDKSLIECWMGSKWGFRKFPLSPDHVRPILGVELDWRAPGSALREIEPGTTLTNQPTDLCLNFDLNVPLGPQLESARILLAGRQRSLMKAGRLMPRNAQEGTPTWQRWLKLLDALDAGAHPKDIAASLQIADFDTELAAAREMVAGGYRRLGALDT